MFDDLNDFEAEQVFRDGEEEERATMKKIPAAFAQDVARAIGRAHAEESRPEPTKEARLHIRVTPENLAAYREAARRDGRQLSQWVRRQLDLAADASSG